PALEQAAKQYKANPNSSTYSQLLSALKGLIASSGSLRISVPLIVKDNAYLNDLKPRVIETNSVRIWNFPRATERNRVLLQWLEQHQQIVGSGRHKKVVTSSTGHLQELTLSQSVNIKDAGILASKESGKHLILAGDSDTGSLLILPFKLGENGWQESPEFLAQIPSFLSNNVCGRIGFRGADLVFNIGKMIQSTDSNGVSRFLPEAESATYKFWLKSTDSGYVLAPSVLNEDAFSAVFQFMQAVQQSRSDTAKALLADSRTLSLPKYLGLQGKPLDSAVRVVEMSVPGARWQRFRLINMAKDDLIFDVSKFKGQWQIKSIFIAAPDAFLAETAKYFPLYSRFEQKAELAEKKDSGSDIAAGSPANPALRRK
ncbi:MAG: hypothetical protein K2X27_14775, partial [Candidatus Obscuribacterales bacterium]|nr:hypothetical protein [Candidatus Obscuribacterales bacterium]